jgi:two-component system, sensor histidine kinase and response regulator
MLLTSAEHPRDAARCRELGITSYLTKPITPSDLLDTLLSVLQTPSAPARDTVSVPQLALTKSQPALHILLVEDNVINQRLTVWMLEKWGHSVVVASNGKEALAALARETFALVLMDVQMSDMDGLATTAAIRQQEQATGAHLPIVAVTAHAMQGDRERCLAAGMDAYLCKPLQAPQLFQVIECLVPAAAGPLPEMVPAAASSEAVFDQHAALARVHGDSELFRDIVDLFFAEIPEILSTFHQAVARGDTQAVEHTAHSLKGTVSSFGAQAACAAALRLEVMGRDGDLTQIAPACAELEREIARLARALSEFREGRERENPHC